MKLNTNQVAELQPDYLGFIFWKNSKRNFTGAIEEISDSIKKIGVFVNASIQEVKEKINTYNLQAVQLHGKESVEFCKELKEELPSIEIIKVFSIKDEFDFCVLEPFETVADYFLFDTKGKLPGGNGYTFNWDVLKQYPSTKPFFLSGGIGLEEVEQLYAFLKTPASKYCHAIDVNSKFEIEPGLKNIDKLKELILTLSN
ncbi:phosphoribosylanthranilate isomerase [Cellulophaga baltica]|uniref:phosphoribosylanthranilate isomerase n=1 Tax=Cellulophaga TaxID=104264 RepID=UPI001C0697B1|nr:MULTISPECIES: phosphoribosylanthranilate isomerase [Cellulophaga]MBU2994954.1 phosphoribosylanthranilate isomerase [Cellulophaga baltica]MDO6766349.1 phosphoribosylanthranilate isomerase [Cellulophaga sp. 1_MG-2023]